MFDVRCHIWRSHARVLFRHVIHAPVFLLWSFFFFLPLSVFVFISTIVLFAVISFHLRYNLENIKMDDSVISYQFMWITEHGQPKKMKQNTFQENLCIENAQRPECRIFFFSCFFPSSIYVQSDCQEWNQNRESWNDVFVRTNKHTPKWSFSHSITWLHWFDRLKSNIHHSQYSNRCTMYKASKAHV